VAGLRQVVASKPIGVVEPRRDRMWRHQPPTAAEQVPSHDRPPVL